MHQFDTGAAHLLQRNRGRLRSDSGRQIDEAIVAAGATGSAATAGGVTSS